MLLMYYYFFFLEFQHIVSALDNQTKIAIDF